MKQETPTVPTQKQYDNALQAWASATAEGGKLITKREAEMQKVSEKYDRDIEKHQKAAAKAFDTVMAYASANRETLFGDAQTLKTPYGTLTFRKSPGKLVLPEDVEKLIMKFKQKGHDLYIITITAIDKKKLITDIAANAAIEKEMARMGVTVETPETFSIK